MGSEVTGSEQLTIRGVVRAVVAELEPGELAALDGLLRHDDEQIRRWLGARRRRGGFVGFGFSDVSLLLTPVVWMALDEAMRAVVGKGVDESAKGLGSVLRRALRRRRGDASVPPALPQLNEAQMSRMRAVVAQSARRRGVSQRRADEIAEMVVARLERGDDRRKRN